jgi:spermidine synthase
VLGDARVSLARTDETFGLLVLDAFSSDAIPVHLLTREALHLYLDRLDEDGVLALHVSNRHFDLKSLLRGLADEHGLLILARDDRVASGSARQSSDWVVMARSASYLGSLIGDKRWTSPAPLEGAVWTDAHSNLLRAIKF